MTAYTHTCCVLFLGLGLTLDLTRLLLGQPCQVHVYRTLHTGGDICSMSHSLSAVGAIYSCAAHISFMLF